MDSNKRELTSMEIDAIGEMLNISMGAAATAVSLLLDKKVSITTPNVQVYSSGLYEFEALQPAIGVEINFIEGITGTNVMIWREEDVKSVVGVLLMKDYTQEEFVMDEMCVSAICEVMNQMMGSASTAMSEFLGRSVNISTPVSFPIDSTENFKKKYFDDESQIISVKFNLIIEGVTNSEFATVLPFELAEEMLSLFASDMAAAEAAAAAPAAEPEPAPAAPASQPAPEPAPKSSASSLSAPRRTEPRRRAPVEETHEVGSVELPMFSNSAANDVEVPDNLKLIMTVPLQITAEIGRTTKTIKEILELSVGSVVELETQAGTPVDILVNNQFVAKGDVVVVDDYYGVRITEILNPDEIINAI